MGNGASEPYFKQRMQRRQWELRFPQVIQGIREHGKKKFLRTRKQKENKAENTGTKAVSGILEKREDQTRKSTFRVLMENKGNFVGKNGTFTTPERP